MGVTLYPTIYTRWIFSVRFPKYRSIYKFIILLAGTIMVAMGLNPYHGIYTTWIFVVTFPKYRFIYDMDFRHVFAKISSLYMSLILLSVCATALLWSQWAWTYISWHHAYTRHGFSLWCCQKFRFINELYHLRLEPVWPQLNWFLIMSCTWHGLSLWDFQSKG
jgi:hypothetical protein